MNATVPDAYHELISLYLRQWSVLRSRLKRQTGSHELAEDALQETWLRLSRMKGGPIDIRDQHAFILRVASNIAIDLARRENRHGGRCISDEAVLAAIEDACPSPERVVIDRDQLRLLVLALSQLPARPRRALLMKRGSAFPKAWWRAIWCRRCGIAAITSATSTDFFAGRGAIFPAPFRPCCRGSCRAPSRCGAKHDQ
jgi:RNA polymerase sigma factor (sigma-70 family)